MLKKSDFVKIRIAVPVSDSEKVRKALAKAGAGEQGNYDNCTGSWRQIGRFRPLKGSNPAIGQQGVVEEVEEEVIETLCHEEFVEKVIDAVKKAHPYEEPAIDIIPRLEV